MFLWVCLFCLIQLWIKGIKTKSPNFTRYLALWIFRCPSTAKQSPRHLSCLRSPVDQRRPCHWQRVTGGLFTLNVAFTLMSGGWKPIPKVSKPEHAAGPHLAHWITASAQSDLGAPTCHLWRADALLYDNGGIQPLEPQPVFMWGRVAVNPWTPASSEYSTPPSRHKQNYSQAFWGGLVWKLTSNSEQKLRLEFA